eukprot:m.950319 g.950319  ORF g.950319 m.950319 type:complete len:182 (+) comp23859_c0_seq13:2898-3443(+)
MRLARNFMVQTEIQYIFIYRAVFDAVTELYATETAAAAQREADNVNSLPASKMATLKRAEAAQRAAKQQEELERQQIEEARLAFEREQQAQLAAKKAEEDLAHRAVTEHSAGAAKAIIKTSISERIKFLDQAEARWLEAYKASLDEWNDRNQFGAEDYDVSSTLTPIQSRMEALRQKGMFV